MAEAQGDWRGAAYLGSVLVLLAIATILTSVDLSSDVKPAEPDTAPSDGGGSGEVTLLAAVQDGNVDAVAELVRAGADVDEGGQLLPSEFESQFPLEPADRLQPDLADERANVPPLLVAAATGNQEMVASLLLAGADPDRAAFGAYTPVYVAAALGHAPVVMTLVNAGANPVPDAPAIVLTPAEAARIAGQDEIADALDVATFTQ